MASALPPQIQSPSRRLGKPRAPPEGEDHGTGVQRTQATEVQMQVANADVKCREGELGGDQHADQHAHDAPHHRHEGELPDHLIVVDRMLGGRARAHGVSPDGGPCGSLTARIFCAGPYVHHDVGQAWDEPRLSGGC